MKQNPNRPIRSTTSQVIAISAALTAFVLGIYCAPIVLEELKTGQTYSLAVIFGSGTKLYRNSSPLAFWVNMGLQMFAFVGMFVAPVFALREVIIEHKRKVAERKKAKSGPST